MGGRGREVVLLLPILHSVIFPSPRSMLNFVMAINSSFHEQPQEDGRPLKRESYEPYYIIVYSVAIRPFSTLKFILGSKVWGNETKKSSSGSAMNNAFLLFYSPKPRNQVSEV